MYVNPPPSPSDLDFESESTLPITVKRLINKET